MNKVDEFDGVLTCDFDKAVELLDEFLASEAEFDADFEEEE